MKSKYLATSASALALAAMALSNSAVAHRGLHPLGPIGHVGPIEAPYQGAKTSGTWTDLKKAFPGPSGPDTALLMTDGTVLMHSWCSVTWWRLTPDKKANYVNGTWKQAGSLPSGYLPFFMASEVLPDGRVMVNGGEYNGSSEGNCGGGVWTTKGALYDPVSDSWTNVSPPSGWTSIGDAQSVILADKTYMVANCCTSQAAIAGISGTTVTWTSTGSGKKDRYDEEGWTQLPGGKIFTVDATIGHGQPSPSEIYDPSTGAWTVGPTAPDELVDPGSSELGPGVLQPDGTLFYFGGAPHNDIYDPSSNSWTKGPDFPLSGYDVADGPAAVLPSGNILVEASPGVFQSPAHFFEYDGKKLNQVNDPKDAPNDTSFEGRMLLLPTGQVLYSNDGQSPTAPEIAVYTPTGKAQAAWLPKITKVSASLSAGSKNNKITGKNFNGFTQGSFYGDDVQQHTNYPIVIITNKSTGDVCFGRSHNFSTMGVANTKAMNAQFDVPSSCETGASTLVVAVNGIQSKPSSVTLK